jgi:hypothetical protein
LRKLAGPALLIASPFDDPLLHGLWPSGRRWPLLRGLLLPVVVVACATSGSGRDVGTDGGATSLDSSRGSRTRRVCRASPGSSQMRTGCRRPNTRRSRRSPSTRCTPTAAPGPLVVAYAGILASWHPGILTDASGALTPPVDSWAAQCSDRPTSYYMSPEQAKGAKYIDHSRLVRSTDRASRLSPTTTRAEA